MTHRSPRLASSSAWIAGLAALCTAIPAGAQVIEAGYPTSSLRTQNIHNGWSGWILGGIFYGAGTDAHGSSGTISHVYDAFNNLKSIRIALVELRNSAGPLVFINDPQQHHFGQVVFTPQVPLPYTVSGNISMAMTGLAPSSSSASGTASLAVVGGPNLATYGASLVRSGPVSTIADIFDSNAPLSGSSTGSLLAGVTYRFSWSYTVASTINGDPFLSANVSSLSDSYMQISFVAPCLPDITTGAIPAQPGYLVPNGVLNNEDFFAFLGEFAAGNLAVCDITTGAVPAQPGYGVPNGVLNNEDFFYYLGLFAVGCP